MTVTTTKPLTEERKLKAIAAAIQLARSDAAAATHPHNRQALLASAQVAEEATGPVSDRVVLAEVRALLWRLADTPTRRKKVHDDARRWLDETWLVGHWYRAHDGATYKVTEIVENDGPKVELIPGITEPYEGANTQTRTISMRAIGATFHHSKLCPCRGGHW